MTIQWLWSQFLFGHKCKNNVWKICTRCHAGSWPSGYRQPACHVNYVSILHGTHIQEEHTMHPFWATLEAYLCGRKHTDNIRGAGTEWKWVVITQLDQVCGALFSNDRPSSFPSIDFYGTEKIPPWLSCNRIWWRGGHGNLCFFLFVQCAAGWFVMKQVWNTLENVRLNLIKIVEIPSFRCCTR